MISFDTFVSNWLGKRTDYDHVYAYQCVDLILQYMADCYGVTQGISGNAIDYWTKPSQPLLNVFEKIPQKDVQKTDIVVLNPTSSNPYGHIGIGIDGATMLEQNGATGDGDGQGGDEIRYRTIPKDRIAGILRLKGSLTMLNEGDSYNVTAKFKEPDSNRFAGQAWSAVFYNYQSGAIDGLWRSLDSVTGIANIRGANFAQIAEALGVDHSNPDESVTQQFILNEIARLQANQSQAGEFVPVTEQLYEKKGKK